MPASRKRGKEEERDIVAFSAKEKDGQKNSWGHRKITKGKNEKGVVATKSGRAC